MLTGADTEARRGKRAAFIEAVLAGVRVLDFTTEVARVHAELHAELMQQGQLIGAHDLIIAATAMDHRVSLLTDNFDEFSRIPDLRVTAFSR